MLETIQEPPSPQVCADKIFEISGTQLELEIAVALWPKILQHKWLMSEKHGCDNGLRAAIAYRETRNAGQKKWL